MLLVDKDGNKQPMVDKRGRFFVLEEIDPEFVKNHVNTELYSEYAGRFVKNAYDPQLTEEDTTLDIDLSVMLKKKIKHSRSRNRNTIIRIAGVPINRYCTILWIHGLSKLPLYVNG